MKVVTTTCAAGPQGVARAGTVLDMPEPAAKEWIKERFAREYKADTDAKLPRGFAKAPTKTED